MRIYIDPGASGGIAWVEGAGICAIKMPESMTAIVDRLFEFTLKHDVKMVVLENVGGYQPGNSGPAACKFARHVGHLEAALYAFGLPTKKIAPNTWMRKLGDLPKGSANKLKRKRAIKDIVTRLLPHTKPTLATADALGMLVAEEGLNK